MESSADDAEDSSSSSLFTSIVDDEPSDCVPSVETPVLLREFRQQWKQELSSDVAKSGSPQYATENGNTKSSKKQQQSLNDEERATELFNQGSELEELGKVFEAMHLYRRAIQIVPDIEQKIYQKAKKQHEADRKLANDHTADVNANGNTNHHQHTEEDAEDGDEQTDLVHVDLKMRFNAAIRRSGRLLHMAQSNDNVISTGSTLHISQLPIEIILYILQWVVSSDLDLISLDQCALVSKGFYLCARDTEIWRLTCLRIWGIHLGSLADSKYMSWRQMYMERPRVQFGGCYISKASYWRFGENSFQDQNYRPIHLVQYYRYVRFFSNGEALMLTTPDEPAQVVNKLKEMSNTSRNDMLKGHFRLHDDLVIMVMKRNRSSNRPALYPRNTIETDKSPTFCVELVIHTKGKRRCNQLQWKNYSIINSKSLTEEVSTNFELDANKYPTLIYSRCKSYHAWSEHALS